MEIKLSLRLLHGFFLTRHGCVIPLKMKEYLFLIP